MSFTRVATRKRHQALHFSGMPLYEAYRGFLAKSPQARLPEGNTNDRCLYRSTKNFKSSGIKGGLGFKSLLITSAKL